MIRLSSLMFILVGPFMAGIFVLIATAAPQLGLNNLGSMGWIVLAGFVVAIPMSFILAKMLPADLMGSRS